MSPTLCQPENQMICEEAKSSTATLTSDTPSRSYASRIWTNWEWEFAACFLVLAIPFISLGTLYPHSSQPLPQWPFKVSINSLLSVYALVFKASIGFILTSCIGQLQWDWFSETRPLTDMLHFDNATRGADGALGLIWRQRFRQPLTALGCIIMILAIAVDPFIQQLVRPVDCSVELSDGNTAATLPRTNVFGELGDDGMAKIDSQTLNKGSWNKVIESALYNAVFNPGQYHAWQCPTGNCTFQDNYGTIGICSACQDVSADIIINAACSHSNYSYASHHPTSSADCPADSSLIIESNFTANEYMKLGTSMKVSHTNNFDTPVVADARVDFDMQTGLGVRGLLFGFLAGATANDGGRIDWTYSGDSPCDSVESKVSWRCQGYGAATCSLQPCVQVYNATISAGVLEEHLVASSSDSTWGTVTDKRGTPVYLALVDTQCPTERNGMNGNTSVEHRWLPYDLNLTDPNYVSSIPDSDPSGAYSPQSSEIHFPDDITSLIEDGCLYLISADDIMSRTSNYLFGTVETGLTGYLSGDSEVLTMSNFEGPVIIRSIYNRGNTDFERVKSTFANISGSLTGYIRTHSGSSYLSRGTKFPRHVQGKVNHYATCLQVQWPWLSYPASLAVLTTLFFLMVVEATRRQQASVWKASPLAWILRAEGPGNEIFPSSHGPCKKMKKRSTQIAVHLFDGDRDGPRIRMADLKDPNLL